jgi:hypothetical protein
MAPLCIGCSGWNCPDTPDKGGGWTEIFYPDKETKRLPHYPYSSLILQKWIPPFMADSSIVWLEIEIR